MGIRPARELVLQHGDLGSVQIAADQGQVQVPALGAVVGPLVRAATMSGGVVRPLSQRTVTWTAASVAGSAFTRA